MRKLLIAPNTFCSQFIEYCQASQRLFQNPIDLLKKSARPDLFDLSKRILEKLYRGESFCNRLFTQCRCLLCYSNLPRKYKHPKKRWKMQLVLFRFLYPRDLIKKFETSCYFLFLFHSWISEYWLALLVKIQLVLSSNLVHGMLCFTY